MQVAGAELTLFHKPASLKLILVPTWTLNLSWVQKRSLWLLLMEIGTDGVKSVLRPSSQGTGMLVLYKKKQNTKKYRGTEFLEKKTTLF